MRLLIYIAIICILRQNCYGQSDVIIPDVKSDKESFSKLNDSKLKNEIAYFNISGSDSEFGKYSKIKVNEIPILKYSDTSIIFSKDSLTIRINSALFDSTGHKLTFVDSKNPFLTLIDDKPFWGTDGGIPRREIRSVVIKRGKQILRLPKKAILGLYEPNFYLRDENTNQIRYICKAFQSLDKRRLYIYMNNSDGAGFYELTWVIQDNKYLTRVIDYGF